MRATLLAGLALLVFFLLVQDGLADTKINSLCSISYPSDSKIEWSCRKLSSKDTPAALFGKRWQDVLRFNRLDRRHFIGGLSIKVPNDLNSIKGFSPLPETPPGTGQQGKLIVVDLSEMFLGAYENGKLVASYPVAVGVGDQPLKPGEYQVDAIDRNHRSNLYKIEEVNRPYPMHYGLRFFVDKSVEGWPSFWIHGRDLPGYPASHGCIGLYDEEMQKSYYSSHDRKVNKAHRELKKPYLKGAHDLYRWVLGKHHDPGRFKKISYGPKVLIIGSTPTAPSDDVKPAD